MSGAVSGRRFRRALTVAVVGTAVVAVPGAAWADFDSSAAGRTSISTDVLAAPPQVITADCGNGKPRRYVTVDWTASPDAYVSGYTVTMTGSDGSSLVATVSGQTTETTIDAQHNTSYRVSVVATYRNWTSAPASAPGTATC